jgi:hypothetical protein
MPIKVRFHKFGTPEEALVDTEAKAVLLTFALADIEVDHHDKSGGITAWDVKDITPRALFEFKAGDEVYVEDPEGHSLDDSTERLETITRIWWRATVLS